MATSVAVIALSIATWRIVSRDESTESTRVAAAVRDESPGRDNSLDAETSAADPRREAATNSPRDPPNAQQSGDAPPVGSDPEEILPLDGRMVFTDAEGHERLDADGTISYVVHGSEPTETGEFAVARGMFRLEFRGDLAFDLVSAKIGGRLAELDVCALWGHSETPVLIRAHEFRPFRARFIDAQSGADVHGVSVVREGSDTRPDDTLGSIAPDSVLLRDTSEPIELEAQPSSDRVPAGILELRAIAPGYEWTSFEADFRRGGRILVRMHAGGSLRVTVIDAPREAAVCISEPAESYRWWQDRMAESGADCYGQLVNRVPLGDADSITFAAIRTGRFVVSVETGEMASAVGFAHEEVDVVAGKSAELVLRCRKIEHAPRAPIAGTVVVPRAWGDAPFDLNVVPIRRPDLERDNERTIRSTDMKCDEGDPRVFHWSDAGVEPAEYSFSVYKLGAYASLQVGSAGLRDVRLVASACGDLELHVLDAATEAPIEGDLRLLWTLDDDCAYEMRRSADTATWVARVPDGSGRLVCRDDEREVLETGPFDVHAGRNELTFHVLELPEVHEFSARLELDLDGWRLPWPDWDEIGIRPLGHDGECHGQNHDEHDDLIFVVSRPGRYEVTVHAFGGFEPVPPFEIDVARDDSTRRKVELRRKGG